MCRLQAGDSPPADGYEETALSVATDLDPQLAGWLTCRGLLTERLRSLPDVRLVSLAESEVELTDMDRALLKTTDRTGRLREISLQAGATRYVYGTSLIPTSLLRDYPWLRALGEEPLGATLTARLEVTRSPFRFRRLAPAEPLALTAADGRAEAALWSRRSAFELPGGRILITEVFLPALAAWPVS